MRVKCALSARESCARIRASFTNDARASNARGYAWFTGGQYFEHVKVDLGEILGHSGVLSLGKPTVSFGEGFRLVSNKNAVFTSQGRGCALTCEIFCIGALKMYYICKGLSSLIKSSRFLGTSIVCCMNCSELLWAELNWIYCSDLEWLNSRHHCDTVMWAEWKSQKVDAAVVIARHNIQISCQSK